MAATRRARHSEQVKLRQAEALRLRLLGHTYREIGAIMALATPYVHTLVKDALYETVAEPAEEVRQHELHRLDMLLTRWLPIAMGTQPAGPGNSSKDAADLVLKIMDRRSRLMGLDKPLQHKVAFVEDVAADLLSSPEGAALAAEMEAFLAGHTAAAE